MTERRFTDGGIYIYIHNIYLCILAEMAIQESMVAVEILG